MHEVVKDALQEFKEVYTGKLEPELLETMVSEMEAMAEFSYKMGVSDGKIKVYEETLARFKQN